LRTAILTLAQVDEVVVVLEPDVPGYVSVFATRIADTGARLFRLEQAETGRISAKANRS
jgi:hypothetical protein